MKKQILLIMVCMFLLIGMVSAAKMKYENEDMKVNFKKSFLGIGGADLGSVELKSHKSVNEKLDLGIGENVVLSYDFKDWKELRKNGLGKVILTDRKTGKIIEREYSFVYWEENNYFIDDYNCNNETSNNCKQIKIENGEWLDYNSKDIPKKNIKIGVKMYVHKGDWIDVVLEVAGKRIKKHAEFVQITETFEADDQTGNNNNFNMTMNALEFGFISGIIFGAGDTGTAETNFSITIYQEGIPIAQKSIEQQPAIFEFTFIEGDYSTQIEIGEFIINQQRLSGTRSGRVSPGNNFAGELFEMTNQIVTTNGAGGAPRQINYTNLEPIVSLNSPEDFFNTTNPTINFNGTIADTTINVSLIIDDVYNETNTSGEIGVYLFTKILSDGVHTWNYEKCNAGECINGTARTLTIDTTPFIGFETPTLPNNTNQTSQNIPINVSITETFFQSISFQLTGGHNFTFTNNTRFINNSFADGIYLYNVTTFTSRGQSNITENRVITIDSTPPTIDIEAPTGTFNILVQDQNISLNFTVIEAGILDTCLLEYNNTNTTIPCTNATKTVTGFDYQVGFNNLTIYANDSVENIGINFTSWTFNILEKNITYDELVIESEQNTFKLFFNTSFAIENAFFTYDGTSYDSNIFSEGGGAYRLETTIQAPTVAIDTNFTFYFTVDTDFNGGVNSTFNNQTVSVLDFDTCGVFTFPTINASLFDEKTLSSINGTVEFDFNLINPIGNTQISNFTTLYENVHTLSSCSNVNISAKDFLYDLELRYFQNGTGNNFNYVPEFYNIQKADTDTLPQNISLYDLNINESTEFTIFYRDDNYITKPNVLIQILRKYVSEGIFRVVEIPITSSEGSAVGHFDLNNYLYKIIITEDGEVLNIFDNPTIRCESEISGICVVNLKGFKQVSQAEGVYQLEDFLYVPSQSNESITITFSSPTGTNKQVRVEMIQTSPFTNPTTLCNTSILSSAGSVSCDTIDSIGDSAVDVKVFSNGVLQANLKASVQEDISDSFMLDNYFIGALLLILLIGMGISSPQIMPWIGVFGLILLGFIFLLKSGSVGLYLGAITWLIVAVIIISFKINQRTES